MPNTKRQRLPIPWGNGIDRSSGALAISPSAFRDLRNVRLANGRTEMRRGYSRMTLLSGGNMVLGIWPIRAQGLTAVAVYDTATRTALLYVVDATGTASALVGSLFTLPADAYAPPSLIGAASYDKLLIAHDEPVYAMRQATMVYAPTEGTITPLLADLARTGVAQPVKFRGVASHLNYIVGWGYGQYNTTPGVQNEDRPETLRISDPGDPTTFIPEHYFLVGMQGDPIIGVDLVGRALAVFKSSESYQLVGYDRPTFGIQPLDPEHGLLGAKLSVSVGKATYFWSLAGPRVMDNDGSIDLAEALWLAGPVPDALATATPSERAFAYYDRDENEVLFVFGQWAYVLHLAGGEAPRLLRWSYRKLGVELLCAGYLWTGGPTVLTPPPGVTPGTPSAIPVSYTPGDADPKFYIPWTFASTPSGVRAEVWVKPTGGAWALRANVPAANGFAVVTEPNGAFLINYDFQVRFTEFGIPAPGYEDPDPSLWPASSLVTVAADGTPAFFAVGRYTRFDPANVGFYGGQARAPGLNQALNVVAYTYETEYADAPGGPWTPLNSGTELAQPWYQQALPNAEYGTDKYFRIRAIHPTGPINGPWLVVGPRTVEPEPPTNVTLGGTDTPGGPNDGTDSHIVTWAAPALVDGVAPADGPYDVRIRHYDTLAFIGPWSGIQAVGFGVHSTTAMAPGVDPSTTGSRTAEVQVRVNNGAGDVSDWVSATTFEP